MILDNKHTKVLLIGINSLFPGLLENAKLKRGTHCTYTVYGDFAVCATRKF